jgi:exopolyphosphatase/guanosine-5'-triphosphate,3'-diphosphate pyrophosphatase
VDSVLDNPATAGDAPGRLKVGRPVAIVDIGSNSVRLVAYEGLTRAPTPIYNEKVLCGLGRQVGHDRAARSGGGRSGRCGRSPLPGALRTIVVGRVQVLATGGGARRLERPRRFYARPPRRSLRGRAAVRGA